MNMILFWIGVAAIELLLAAWLYEITRYRRRPQPRRRYVTVVLFAPVPHPWLLRNYPELFMDTTIIAGAQPVIAQGQIFAADADGNPTGDALTPDSPLTYAIADNTIATIVGIDATTGLPEVQGVAAGTTTIAANGAVGGVAATPQVGTITVEPAQEQGKFVTTITWPNGSPGAQVAHAAKAAVHHGDTVAANRT